MAFRVEMSAQAEIDAISILEWLESKQAGEAGLRWFLGLEEAIKTLSELPGRCALAPESRHFPFEIRHLLHGRKPHIYRILFTIRNDTVEVLQIRHGRRLNATGFIIR